MQKFQGNILIAQGGGPTPVISASLKGVIEEAKKYPQINGIYGARYGVEGLFNEEFIDLEKEPKEIIDGLAFTPAAVLGSCRRKLTGKDYPMVLEILKKYNIRYLFYNGGNDSMDTCDKIAKIAGNYDIKVIGVPKTIDNDLAFTDHCPGFGSAARYAAISAMELYRDVESLPIHVCVLELMGRNAGWITAAASLAKEDENDGPHLVYLPERPFLEEEFLEDVKMWHEKVGGVLVVVSEGLKDQDGNPLAESGIVDGFGHKVPGGVSQHLSNLIIDKLGIKSRSEKPGLLGRCSISLQSAIDRDEAIRAGEFAVKSAVEGKSGYMVSVKRVSNVPYKSEMALVPLDEVANVERKMPDKFINERGNGIMPAFKEYCMPLIGEPLPNYVRLKKVPVKKIQGRLL